METKLLKVQTTGTRLKGNLRPTIADRLPKGVTLIALEYDEADASAIVKLCWSSHALAVKPSQSEIQNMLKDDTIIETVASHPLQDELKTKHMLSPQAVKIDKGKVKLKSSGVEVSFIRKEKVRDEQDEYVLDEG